MSTSLVVFYSRTGNTRRLAHLIADASGGLVEELVEATDHTGHWGWVKSVAEAATGWMPGLLPPLQDPSAHPLIFLGGPIWMGRCAPVVRSYASRHLGQALHVAFFATQGGTDPYRAWADLTRLSGIQPAATLSVQDTRSRDPRVPADVAHFVASARAATHSMQAPFSSAPAA